MKKYKENRLKRIPKGEKFMYRPSDEVNIDEEEVGTVIVE